MYDAIVIGAGPAGLQAALTLGRMHRSTLVLDSGVYRNATVAHMHNVIGNDGTAPAAFRATARAQLEAYADVSVRDVGAERISAIADGFSVALADGSVEAARRIVLATGIADTLPDVPGLGALWGRSAFSCPFCDGHEHSGTPIAILGAGPRAAHLIGMLRGIVGDITVFPLADAVTDEDRRMIEDLGARVHPAPVESVEPDPSGARLIAGGESFTVAGIFVSVSEASQRAPFADQLGLRMLPSGAIEIDEFGRTSLPGVSAAGDLAHRATLPGPVASVVLAAAAGQMAAVGVVQSFLAAAH